MSEAKDKGNKLELYVAGLLKKIFPKARPSNGSGAHGEIGDIAGITGLVIECKSRNIKNFVIQKEWWEHLNNEIPIGSPRLPIIVGEDGASTKYAILSREDFVRIYEGYLKGESK